MKNFCTDIIETAKMKGLSRGGQCRSNNGEFTVVHNTSNNLTRAFTYVQPISITFELGGIFEKGIEELIIDINIC